MNDRSSRPHRQPNRTPAPVVRKIVHLRWKRGWVRSRSAIGSACRPDGAASYQGFPSWAAARVSAIALGQHVRGFYGASRFETEPHISSIPAQRSTGPTTVTVRGRYPCQRALLMTRRYRRRGHYRRSPNGGRHYVRTHTVNGSSWSSWGSAPTTRSAPPSRTTRTARKPATPPVTRRRFIQLLPSEPNATCPICGASVYFWRNSAGSKVWFDALGRPWPKHPCLDLAVALSAPRQTKAGLRKLTRIEVKSAQRTAKGPLPPARVVTAIAPPESAGCLTLLAWTVTLFLVACVLNWWRMTATGDRGAVGTAVATAIALVVIATCFRFLRRVRPTGLDEAKAQWAKPAQPMSPGPGRPIAPWAPESTSAWLQPQSPRSARSVFPDEVWNKPDRADKKP